MEKPRNVGFFMNTHERINGGIDSDFELAAVLVKPDPGPVELMVRTAIVAIYVKYIVRGPLLEVNHGKNR